MRKQVRWGRLSGPVGSDVPVSRKKTGRGKIMVGQIFDRGGFLLRSWDVRQGSGLHSGCEIPEHRKVGVRLEG